MPAPGRVAFSPLGDVAPHTVLAVGGLGAAILVARGSGTSAILALVICIALLSAPVATIVGLVVAAQENQPGRATDVGGWFSFGNEIYLGAKVPPVAVLLLAATLVAYLKARPRLTGVGFGFLATVSALAAWATLYSIALGAGPLSALNQDSRPFILAALAFVLGRCLLGMKEEVRRVENVAFVVLLAWALFGASKAAAGAGAELGGSQLLIFYDAAMGAIAAGAALAALFVHRASPAKRWLVVGVGVAISVLALRRNIWVGSSFALCCALVASRLALGAVTRVVVLCGTVAVVLSVLSSRFRETLAYQFESTLAAFHGQSLNASTAGHITDIEVGWDRAIASPWGGIGPQADAFQGLVLQTGRVYVHNEYLLDWLRFGIVGLLLSLSLAACMVVLGFRVLRASHDATLLGLWGGMVLLLASVAMIAVPFLSTTTRWPILLGLAAGVAAAQLSRLKQEQPARAQTAGRGEAS